MFTTTLFTIAKMWKQPKSPSASEWIKNIQYIHTIKFQSAIKKKKEILQIATTRMEFQDTMLSEINQTKTNTT